MTLVKCLSCKHVWNLESDRLPRIGEKLDEKTLKEPCPNCGLIASFLYVGTNVVGMRVDEEDMEIIKEALDFTANVIQSSKGGE